MWSVQRIRNTRYVMVISGRYNSSRSRCYIWSECYHLYYAYEVFFRNGLLSRVSTLVRGPGQLPALGLALTPLFHFLHHHKQDDCTLKNQTPALPQIETTLLQIDFFYLKFDPFLGWVFHTNGIKIQIADGRLIHFCRTVTNRDHTATNWDHITTNWNRTAANRDRAAAI